MEKLSCDALVENLNSNFGIDGFRVIAIPFHYKEFPNHSFFRRTFSDTFPCYRKKTNLELIDDEEGCARAPFFGNDLEFGEINFEEGYILGRDETTETEYSTLKLFLNGPLITINGVTVPPSCTIIIHQEYIAGFGGGVISQSRKNSLPIFARKDVDLNEVFPTEWFLRA